MGFLILGAIICGGLFLLARMGDVISLSRGTHRWQYRQRRR